MKTFADRLLAEVGRSPGLSDRELTELLLGRDKHSAQVTQEARLLEQRARIIRQRRADGIIGNYPAGSAPVLDKPAQPFIKRTPERLSEDEVKESLETWLRNNGWVVSVAWGMARGIDVEAVRGSARWLIEVKGLGSRQPMRVNYFLAILGETLQRMADPDAKYSIALPDIPQFRGLWNRLPALAKERTAISCLFVTPDGAITEA